MSGDGNASQNVSIPATDDEQYDELNATIVKKPKGKINSHTAVIVNTVPTRKV